MSKAKEGETGPGKELSESERAELDRLRKESTILPACGKEENPRREITTELDHRDHA